MSRLPLLLVESNTSGTGRLLRAARELGLDPVLVTARPEKYACLSQGGARTEIEGIAVAHAGQP